VLPAFIFYSLLFLMLFLLPAAVIFVVLLLLQRRQFFWERAAPVIQPIRGMLFRSGAKAYLQTKFPATARHFARRFDTRSPWGLSATMAGLVIWAGIWVFLGVVEDIAAKDPLVVLDLRLHNSIPLFRTPAMTRFMLVVTELGGGICLTLLALGAACLALARGRARVAATLLLALCVTALLAASLKALFGTARPVDAIIGFQEASFPSGHMLSGTVVYGLFAALLLESKTGNGLRALGVPVLLSVIVGIGLSRLYLGVHWASDLLASLALALIALAGALFFLNYPARMQLIDGFSLPLGPRASKVLGMALIGMAAVAVAVLPSRVKILQGGVAETVVPIDIKLLQHSLPPGTPQWSEDLIGSHMEPISLVFIGSERAILETFARAGWTRADAPTPVRVLQEGIAALWNRSDPTGPATPAYFMDHPQSLTLEKPDSTSPSIRRRHHTRLWRTRFCIEPACRPLWVATASFDVGLELSKRSYLPTHRIDAALDTERALIAADLTAVGARLESNIEVTPPTGGTNAIGDPFWTDGQALVITMP
jgi:membrane-associated phospholipid phosphatase